MKKKILLLSILAYIFLSCEESGPKVYTSISGTWRCEEINPIIGDRVYLVDIDRKRADTTQYLISNFYNTSDLDYIVVKLKSSQFTLAQQSTADINIKSFNGNLIGTNFKRIELTYKIYDGIRDISASAILTRK